MNVGWGENWIPQIRMVMDVLNAQHQAIANNIANVNTPAYTKLKVDFNQELERLLQPEGASVELSAVRDSSRSLGIPGPESSGITPVRDEQAPARADGNNVSMEQEMVELAESNEAYSALAKIANKSLRITRYVISGGKG